MFAKLPFLPKYILDQTYNCFYYIVQRYYKFGDFLSFLIFYFDDFIQFGDLINIPHKQSNQSSNGAVYRNHENNDPAVTKGS